MTITNKQQRELDSCLKRFERQGHFLREQLTEQWYQKKAKELASKHTGGVVIRCVDCSSDFYVSADEIQYYRKNRKRHPRRCPNCRKKEDIAFLANNGTPYRNRVFDNMELGLSCVGTGQERWSKGMGEGARQAFYMPTQFTYDSTNEELVAWVNEQAREGLAKAQEKYDSTNELIRRFECSALAPYVWILDGSFSTRLYNLACEYVGLPIEKP